MQNKNIGLIIYVKPIKDNDLYIKILSANDIILSGLVYGGNSSKKKSIYQIGYLIEFSLLQKNLNSVSSINGEIISPYIANIYNDKFKLFSLLAITSILNESIYEGVKIKDLYISVEKLIISINSSKHWIIHFCRWLLYFLKLLGYEIDYIDKNNIKYFNLNSLSLQKINTSNDTILFPHILFNQNPKITYESVHSLFTIFETVFIKSNINNYFDKMPVNYINFKILILKKLENIYK